MVDNIYIQVNNFDGDLQTYDDVARIFDPIELNLIGVVIVCIKIFVQAAVLSVKQHLRRKVIGLQMFSKHSLLLIR